MSIFGPKNYDDDLTLPVNDLNREILDDLHREILDDLDRKILPLINGLSELRKNVHTNTEIIKHHPNKYITISAESKGPLTDGKVFSFGNAGRVKSVGYVVMRSGYIVGISLSSKRSDGEVRVGVMVDEKVLQGYDITLNTTPRKHDNFSHPFYVAAGSVINFVSLENNVTAVNTVASLLFEF